MNRAFATLIFLCSGMAFAAPPPPAAQQEIKHLLAYLKDSGCEFNRNGTWYGANEATGHLKKKYDYLLKKELVASAEDFIRQAATESSMSGKPYTVRCGASSPSPSGEWFKAELEKHRAAHR
jgi:hypothetical protein